MLIKKLNCQRNIIWIWFLVLRNVINVKLKRQVWCSTCSAPNIDILMILAGIGNNLRRELGYIGNQIKINELIIFKDKTKSVSFTREIAFILLINSKYNMKFYTIIYYPLGMNYLVIQFIKTNPTWNEISLNDFYIK